MSAASDLHSGMVGASFGAGAATYDRARRQLIPCFDAFYAAAVALAPFDEAAPLRVLDLGAGTGLLSSFFAARYERATFRLVDLSADMLDLARRRFDGDQRFSYEAADLAEQPRDGATYDLIISALAIHHLDDRAKRALFARVRDALAPGGTFINADQVAGRTAATTARNHQMWLDGARALGVSDADLGAALERMRHDRMAPLADQLAWLTAAGFEDADCTFQSGMFAVFSGCKPGNPGFPAG